MMKLKTIYNAFLGVGFLFTITGCADIPHAIRGNDSQLSTMTWTKVMNDPALYKGQQVRFGGMVVNVINHERETLLEVAVQSLDSSAKPELDKPYLGRVIARYPGYLEPLSFRNRLVTLLGTVTGTTSGKIGSANTRFLQMDLTGYQIWHVSDRLITTGYWDYGVGPYWDNGWDTPGYPYGWGWYPQDSTTIVQPVVTR